MSKRHSLSRERWGQAAQAAKQGIVIVYSPVPLLEGLALQHWCDRLEAAMVPWLSPLQFGHLQCFGSGEAALKARCSRLLARALLVRLVMAAAQTSQSMQPTDGADTAQQSSHDSHLAWLSLEGLDMDYLGRPVLPGWHAAFSHSGQVAFCAVRFLGHENKPHQRHQPHNAQESQAQQDFRPSLAVDAESLTSLPPDSRAFSGKELTSPIEKKFQDRDALRRWTIKEALLKSAGLGLSRDPALVHSGFSGQRRGLMQFCREGSTFFSSEKNYSDTAEPCRQIGWQLVPCAGHWLCVAAPVSPGNPLVVSGRPLRAHWRCIFQGLIGSTKAD
ncbi:MAG: 4'-phosphopantetheinyl transferase superfamily protein [Desulfovibrio sp.]|uniref:4'-phosphopantetheinyl transferase superfamily protein n=1 Tax=Desulfovibrio sp. TaxID=885 RepID=UPI0039E2CDFC